jgi:hypothetical protein
LVANPERIRDDATQVAGTAEMAEGGGDENALSSANSQRDFSIPQG